MGVMDGVKVLEVAQWWFVPAGGAVLADWGAEVIKVEHPVLGDSQRGLAAEQGMTEGGRRGGIADPHLAQAKDVSVGVHRGHAMGEGGGAFVLVHGRGLREIPRWFVQGQGVNAEFHGARPA